MNTNRRRDPQMAAHSYPGNYQSAIARAKKTLLAAGFAWSRKIGRYHPFANEQVVTHGVKVTRVGCSDTIAISVYGPTSTRAEEKRAIDALRAAGLPFDDRGWLDCGVDATPAPVKAEPGYSDGRAFDPSAA